MFVWFDKAQSELLLKILQKKQKEKAHMYIHQAPFRDFNISIKLRVTSEFIISCPTSTHPQHSAPKYRAKWSEY